MMKCEACGHVFEDSEVAFELTGVTLAGMREIEATCPSCGDTGIADARQCDRCGGWFLIDEMDYDADTVCSDCVREVRKAILNVAEAQFPLVDYKIISGLMGV